MDVTWEGEPVSAKLSVARAREILLEKLAVLGIKEMNIYQAWYYEEDGAAFYDVDFVPSYEGISVAYEFGMTSYGEIHPYGKAWINADGVAFVNLVDFLGKTVEQEDAGKILAFSQVTDILEKYLENETLCGYSQAALTQVELVYYPDYSEPELSLIPAWHIYVPLKEKIDSIDRGEVWKDAWEKEAVWNIYMDAVTGELLKVE